MSREEAVIQSTIPPEPTVIGEGGMVREEGWKEVQRLWRQERLPVSEIARRLDLDRKTVRRCLKQQVWQPYARSRRTDTLLAEYETFLRDRAPEVCYSARILFQELRRDRGYRGSYETVKRFVQPLREALALAERASVRFETPPGQQSQIDWGMARVRFRDHVRPIHVFVLTLGFSRRGLYEPCLGETLPQFLDAHERAFEHFGGHTREHLYDRPRTVCQPRGDQRFTWNPTFKHFADFWGFEPRVCRPYRAQTKGKVESGVKYFRRNFLPGRTFVDFSDLREQLADWMRTISDVRIHGTTHERPIDRFAREQPFLIPTAGHPIFRLEARQPRIVASDYLVTLDTNRYSVPFPLIGQTVDVLRRDRRVRIFHRGALVAEHPELVGTHQLRVLPEHGPGVIARNARQRRSCPSGVPGPGSHPEVEIRDLAYYEALVGGAA